MMPMYKFKIFCTQGSLSGGGNNNPMTWIIIAESETIARKAFSDNHENRIYGRRILKVMNVGEV